MNCLPPLVLLPHWRFDLGSPFLHLESARLPQVRARLFINKPSCQPWQASGRSRKQEGLSVSRGRHISTAPIWPGFILQASRASTIHYFLSLSTARYQDLCFHRRSSHLNYYRAASHQTHIAQCQGPRSAPCSVTGRL